MAYDARANSKAFGLFLSGLSLDKIIKEMRKEYPGFAKETVRSWIKDGDWESERADYQRKQLEREKKLLSLEDDLMDSLLAQKERYEKKFAAAVDGIDTQDNFGYVKVIELLNKTLERRAQKSGGEVKIDKPALFLEFLGEFSTFVAPQDPEAASVLERYIDPFIEIIKKKYAT